MTSIALIALLICIFFVPQLHEHASLLYIGALKLISNLFLIEWLYKGLEEFEFITKRTIAIKILYVCSIFLFIKEADDYVLYFICTTLMFVVNAIVNFIKSFSFVRLSFLKVNPTFYIKPFFILGSYLLLTSLYTTFNVAFLGFATNEYEVGYYTTATKLHSIILALFTAFTGVMLPHMSSLLSKRKFDEFEQAYKNSINILLTFSIPIIILAEFLAPHIVFLLAGEGYEGAIMPMRIVLPLVLIIGLEQILIVQILTPMGKDKAIFINSLMGATFGCLFNFLLVRSMGSVGSAITWAISEFAVLISASVFVSRYICLKFPVKPLLHSLFYNLPILLICISISMMKLSWTLQIVLMVSISCLVFSVVQFYWAKNSIVIIFFNRLRLLIANILYGKS